MATTDIQKAAIKLALAIDAEMGRFEHFITRDHKEWSLFRQYEDTMWPVLRLACDPEFFEDVYAAWESGEGDPLSVMLAADDE